MSEAQRKLLVRQRGTVKAKLTSFSNYVKSLGAKASIEMLDIIELNERMQRVDTIFAEYNELQNDLDQLASDETIENEYIERSTFSDNFYTTIALAKRLVLEHEAKERPVVSVPQFQQSNSELCNVKLPTIDLPKFDGTFDAWLEFRDTFESLIHVNTSINSMQKYHYLRASLRGSATQVIKSIEFTANNYSIAWDTLCDRYDNTRLLVFNHTKALFSLESIQKESSTKIRNLMDSVSKHLRSLNQLKQPTEQWDTLVIYLVTTKLDSVSAREWEQYKTGKDVPTLEDLKTFLKGRADLLETLEIKNDSKVNATLNVGRGVPKKEYATKGFHVTNLKCVFCKGDHAIYKCEDFEKLTVNERIDFVRRMRLCSNCLKSGHFEKNCRFGSCKKCEKRHNTLLHLQITQNSNQNSNKENSGSNSTNNEASKITACTSKSDINEVLLGTAYVQVLDKFQKPHTVRALLDCGSQSSFITADLANKLKLEKTKINLSIECLMNMQSQAQYRCDIQVQSPQNGFKSNLSCIILPQIASNLPSVQLNPNCIEIPRNIKLADLTFYKPGNIDILIGADLFWKLMCVGQIDLGRDKPVLQKTRFGWIVAGPFQGIYSNKTKCNLATNLDLQRQISKFWEVEECPTTQALSSEERACEKHFVENTCRDSSGRFIVSLPLKAFPNVLGDSKEQAITRFNSLERKLQRDENLRIQYTNFLSEYQILGHMSEKENDNTNEIYYMPHHGVLKSDSVTTKLRVVFDASAPTTSGISLNDIQMVGPTIQDDLLSIILRFRKHVYVVSSDIAKMYRQVVVKNEQRALQCILWRSSPSDELKTYTLNTVTYGQASASFLSIRCLFELANQCESKFPNISEIIRHDFYVDDLLTGADTIQEVAHICKTVSEVLKEGCFELRKWVSNEPKVLDGIHGSDISYNVLNFGENQNAKTLGLIWNCSSDKLMFKIDTSSLTKNVTKRTVLSHISQIFDPLGLLSPCTIIAKLIMQRLWLERLSWDESLPVHLHSDWITFKCELPVLNSIEIPRLASCKDVTNVELHGFSDASEAAYGGCIFLKSTNKSGEISVHLLCSKSKVAPIKALTMPRLELCGALILSRLAEKVMKALNINFSRCVFWTDSTIVLGWIKTSPHLLKAFISNRVSEIQELTNSFEWRHVPTKCNPADLLTRGVPPSQIQQMALWWHGPEWLAGDSSHWPNLVRPSDDLPELREPTRVYLLTQKYEDILFHRYSNFSKLKRVLAYILRFINNCKKNKSERQVGFLSQIEINNSLNLLIKLSQIESFPNEYNCLMEGKNIHRNSRLLSLNPFIDENNLIRVGGRLRNSNFNDEKKHPFLIGPKHKLTKIIFASEHLRLLHAGPQLLLSSIREKFWPIDGRNIAKGTVRNCVKCFRFNPKNTTPIMGDLPQTRLLSESPFYITGVDYGGPFLIKNRRGRGSTLAKCYMCLFICFATKCIHLELVSDLTAEAFVLALRRFVSRRGKPARIYSDNGTNFVRANKELKALGNFLATKKDQLLESISIEGLDWHFIPPLSPHFGGLWEAGIKGAKHHLKRVMGNSSLTFEELNTLLVQVEAVLNSRPLYPISSDPNDLYPITPAHFLIGKTLTSVPDPDVRQIPESRTSRYQRLQQLLQHFWSRWRKEYVGELQQRHRWKTSSNPASNPLQEGSLVILKEDNLPPLHWRMGRIVQFHPGSDGISRVASVKTSNGIVQRNVQRMCPLPIEQ